MDDIVQADWVLISKLSAVNELSKKFVKSAIVQSKRTCD